MAIERGASNLQDALCWVLITNLPVSSTDEASNGQLRFHRVNAPTSKELNALVATISATAKSYPDPGRNSI